MATSTELLRAAEHMREVAARELGEGMRTTAHMTGVGAEALEREAKRLQAIEAQPLKRSWPEGWPPFAVLRRAYRGLRLAGPTPSLHTIEQAMGSQCEPIRRDWAAYLRREIAR